MAKIFAGFVLLCLLGATAVSMSTMMMEHENLAAEAIESAALALERVHDVPQSAEIAFTRGMLQAQNPL